MFFRTTHHPVEARVNGEVCTESISASDFVAADPGPLDSRFLGRLASECVLECEFDLPLDFPAALVVDGWVEYPYSQTMFAAWQSGACLGELHFGSARTPLGGGRWCWKTLATPRACLEPWPCHCPRCPKEAPRSDCEPILRSMWIRFAWSKWNRVRKRPSRSSPFARPSCPLAALPVVRSTKVDDLNTTIWT